MSITLTFYFVLFGFFSRPYCPPISVVDIQNALKLEKEYKKIINAPYFIPCPLCTTGYAPGRFVIGFYPGTQNGVLAWVENCGGRAKAVNLDAGFITAEFPTDFSLKAMMDKGATVPGIRFLEPDFFVFITHIPNDPFFLAKQWDKWVMYADEAWDIKIGGSVKVAVVDNGVEYSHQDLAANFQPGELGYDFIGRDNDPKPDNPDVLEAFHGTHVAGIIAAIANNSIGIAGWAQVQLLAVRVLNDSGKGLLSDVALGIRWAVDRGARIINMSLGGSSFSTPLIEACRYALNRGAVLVAASGNDGQPTITYPARLAECIAVGAMDEFSNLASFSNYGPEQEVVAPGVGIYSTTLNNTYREADGTSMSCPEVSGVAALILALEPGLTPGQVRAIISSSAIDMGLAGKDDYFGYGLVNGYRALELTRVLHRVGVKSNPLTSTNSTTIFRKTFSLPPEVVSAIIYDKTGRSLFNLPGKKDKIQFSTPGIYFINLSDKTAYPRQAKLIVLP